MSEPPAHSALIALPKGTFTMGDTGRDRFATDTERPAHRVTIAHAFALGGFPVTLAEYRRFVPGHAEGEDERLPVANVTWEEAHAYCRWLAEREGKPFRLPAEAEWEYACRAGTQTPFSTGAGIDLSAANYLYDENGGRIGIGTRTPRGAYAPNAFGLSDMHGNVCEWVEDVWHADYREAPADGSAWIGDGDPDRRVIRGGAWDYLPRLLRSAWRDWLFRDRSRDNVGFRVACTL
jgi:formylglycine-generating enzyme required for sulfatase activity